MAHIYPHRCSKCNHRKTLRKKWADYVRPPKCEECGHKQLYLCRDRMAARWGRKHKCLCGGYEFMHRKGSKYCYHSKQADRHQIERRDGPGADLV
jgi:hypothetical protein